MKIFTTASVLCIALMVCSSRAFADGGPPYLLNKVQVYFQNSATVPAIPVAYNFGASAPAADTLTLTGGLSAAVPFIADQGGANLSISYSSKAAMDAAFPDGTYTYKSLGTGTSVLLTPDSYPSAAPQVTSGGTSTNGVLMLDPTVANTIQFSTNTGYGAPGNLGYMQFQINAQSPNDSASLKQTIATQAIFGLTPSSTPLPLTSFRKGSLTAGNVYQGEIDFANLLTLNANAGGGLVSLFENTLTFYVVAKGSNDAPCPHNIGSTYKYDHRRDWRKRHIAGDGDQHVAEHLDQLEFQWKPGRFSDK